jgi:hypothetical protein
MLWKDVVAADVAPLQDGDIAGAISLLRSASLRELRNEAFLREEFLLTLGLNAEPLLEFPRQLHRWCGCGIRSWQYPVQFASYLTYLAEKDIRSYVEIGVRFGGTFIIIVEYMRRFCDLYRACALDMEPTSIMETYARQTAGVEYKIGNSLEPELRAFLGSAAWDLALIDGNHSYEGCSTDFKSIRHRSKLIALHDISSGVCPGVRRMWEEIKNIVPASRLFEATDQYKEVRERTNATYLGIGVVDFSYLSTL